MKSHRSVSRWRSSCARVKVSSADERPSRARLGPEVARASGANSSAAPPPATSWLRRQHRGRRASASASGEIRSRLLLGPLAAAAAAATTTTTGIASAGLGRVNRCRCAPLLGRRSCCSSTRRSRSAAHQTRAGGAQGCFQPPLLVRDRGDHRLAHTAPLAVAVRVVRHDVFRGDTVVHAALEVLAPA